MSMLDRLTRTPDLTEVDRVQATLDGIDLAEQLDVALNNLELVQESYAELEGRFAEPGWQAITTQGELQFTRQGLLDAARLCRVMALANPLIRRALALRTAYVWGGGVEINARATGKSDSNPGEQDVNTVVQAFLDDPATRKVLTSAGARERNERTLGTDGVFALALFTHPVTGGVQAREILTDEIVDVVTNPEDASEVWFYKRIYTPRGGGGPRTVLYPDLRFRPRGVAKMLRIRGEDSVGAVEVQWDAPVAFLKVNDLSGWDFGIGDVYSAIPWARAYKEFLTDWAKLVKSLSRFAWRLTAPTKPKTLQAAAEVRAAVGTTEAQAKAGADLIPPVPVGGTAATTSGTVLEAIPKSGATIDSESGRPLASMVAAGTDVPLTMLLGDPGVTGARATAETLDSPTELMAKGRRSVWQHYLRDVLDYVVDQAVKAPRGPLAGTVGRDEWGREVVTLAGDTDRTIEFDWPDLTETPADVLVGAIKSADDTGKMPPLTTLRLLLQALGVRDIEELLEKVTDENGDWVDQEMSAGQVAVDAYRRGGDAERAAAEALG